MGRKTDIARQGRGGKAPSPAAPPPPRGPLPAGERELAGSFWRRNRTTLLVLGGILILAGGLRFVNLGQSPPGTVDDECVEIWNAYCIEQTGHDWHGESWPVLSTRALGYNLPTIFMYCLVPFQSAMGMSLTSARFATAVLGTLDVLLLFGVAWRLFGRGAGLLAAAMLALCPWHLRNSRYAFLANSIFIILPIALMMLANLPLQNAVPRRPRPLLALLAGAVMGMCCYGYPSVRLFLPLFLIGAVAVSWRGWWQLLRARGGALALGALVLGLAVTLGPLVYAHLAHPERMAKRSANIMIWAPTDSLATKVEKAAARYLPHFGADFLFIHGDGEEGRSVVRRVPETGAFQWYLLPAMLAGLAAALWKVRTSHAARVLLAGVILYPAADLAFQAQGVHLYRSLPGLPMLILLSAFGAEQLGAWLWARKRPLFWGAACAMGLWVVVWSAPFFNRFYVDYNRLPKYYDSFECALVDAVNWVRPRMEKADGLFIATDPFAIRSIYLVTLVGLEYDPHQWFRDAPDIQHDAIGGDVDWVSDFGKVHFGYNPVLQYYWRGRPDAASLPLMLYDLPAWKELQRKKSGAPVYLVVPPGYPGAPAPAYEVRRPDGKAVLWVCEERL